MALTMCFQGNNIVPVNSCMSPAQTGSRVPTWHTILGSSFENFHTFVITYLQYENELMCAMCTGGRVPAWHMVPGSSTKSLALDVALQCLVPFDVVQKAAHLFKVSEQKQQPFHVSNRCL